MMSVTKAMTRSSPLKGLEFGQGFRLFVALGLVDLDPPVFGSQLQGVRLGSRFRFGGIDGRHLVTCFEKRLQNAGAEGGLTHENDAHVDLQ